MKYVAPLLVIDDMERSKQFYSEVLDLCVICDFGANVTLTGGMSLQTRESWKDFIHKPDGQIVYHGNDAELYFEEADFDGFVEKLHSLPIEYVHDVQELSLIHISRRPRCSQSADLCAAGFAVLISLASRAHGRMRAACTAWKT